MDELGFKSLAAIIHIFSISISNVIVSLLLVGYFWGR